MRTFDSGATRDDNTHKLNYVRGLSTQVQQRYLEYLGSHRLQKDGSVRDWDNWKKGMDPEAYRESLSRHTNDAVQASMGLPVPESATLQDLLCAIIFNASGWLFELLVAESGNRELGQQQHPTCGECADFALCAYNVGVDAEEPADACFTPKGGM
jgi:hypothetical protein